jgi:hypothetical protein
MSGEEDGQRHDKEKRQRFTRVIDFGSSCHNYSFNEIELKITARR